MTEIIDINREYMSTEGKSRVILDASCNDQAPLRKFNEANSSLRLTLEVEENDSLLFLDVPLR